jgi:hypothetical protein
MSRSAARLLLGLLALIFVGGPVAYYVWYFNAAQVTVTVTGCHRTARGCPNRGTWTMPDGTAGSGSIDGLNDAATVGEKQPARATRSWAVTGGPLSGPGVVAAFFLGTAAITPGGAAYLIIRARRRLHRPPPTARPDGPSTGAH